MTPPYELINNIPLYTIIAEGDTTTPHSKLLTLHTQKIFPLLLLPNCAIID